MDWHRLKIFYWVARAGSFRQASDDLNVSATAISRQIALLEKELKAKLFLRHARGLQLTELGETLYQTARIVYAETRKAESLLETHRSKPEGTLRVTTSLSFGNVWLAPRLSRFVERYPNISIELLVGDTDLDIFMREADIAIRFESSEHPELIRKPLTTIRFHAWAMPGYLSSFGAPKSRKDLNMHRLISYVRETPADDRAYNWILWAGTRDKAGRKPVLRTDTLFGAFQAVRKGLGIAVLPEYYAWEYPELVQVLPGRDHYQREVNFLYAPESRQMKRLEVFRDFVAEELLLEQRRK